MLLSKDSNIFAIHPYEYGGGEPAGEAIRELVKNFPGDRYLIKNSDEPDVVGEPFANEFYEEDKRRDHNPDTLIPTKDIMEATSGEGHNLLVGGRFAACMQQAYDGLISSSGKDEPWKHNHIEVSGTYQTIDEYRNQWSLEFALNNPTVDIYIENLEDTRMSSYQSTSPGRDILKQGLLGEPSILGGDGYESEAVNMVKINPETMEQEYRVVANLDEAKVQIEGEENMPHPDLVEETIVDILEE